MKVFGSVLFVVLAARAAAADPIALDYKAEDASCIDASRFADEVSAKLGFVPWGANAPATIRVRVTHDGAQFSGSVKNVDGTAKIIDGATCAEVTSNLAVTVAAAVDQRPATPAKESAPGDDMVPVTFESVEGRRIDVRLGAGSVAVSASGDRIIADIRAGVCTTPCSARLPRGRQYLSFSDPDEQMSGQDRFMFDGPATITIGRKSRHGTRVGFFIAGVALAGASVASIVMLDSPAKWIVSPISVTLTGFSFLGAAY
ncbi:MAG: hypothetical protein HOV81_22865, partial [Kofleriaceae bacterium]|nr:hypothetical protein [Kofleriaceae bacterium]